MLVDKNVKNIYAGGSKISAIVHKGEIIWGHFEEKLNINVVLGAFGGQCTIEAEGKEYVFRSNRRRKLTASKTEFTFIVKANGNSRYKVVLNSKAIFENEVGTMLGAKYTLSLDKLRVNNIYIDFRL
jgi:hypothetical protein